MRTQANRLVLPEDLKIVPVAELPAELSSRFQHDEGAYAVSRPRSRARTRIVDPGTARLLEEFRTPTTVADAILSYSRTVKKEPEDVLLKAHPILVKLAEDHILVPEESRASRRIEPSLISGDRVGDFEIMETISVLDDTELFRARTSGGNTVALKLARQIHAHALAPSFEHEANILRFLDGTVSPRLIDQGAWRDRPFLAMEWIQGAQVGGIIHGLVDPADVRERQERLTLCVKVLERYADLHGKGILHGDVYPGNILVTAAGDVYLVDFALALNQREKIPSTFVRGGVLFFLEPEAVSGETRRMSPPTEAGEQYSLGAILYLLMTGATYLDFRLDRHEIVRQLTEDTPHLFVDVGVPPWPEVEATIYRALAKQPEDRHASVQEFADALRVVLSRPEKVVTTPRRSSVIAPESRDFLDSYLSRVRIGGERFVQGYSAPKGSVMFGAAGMAYALYRMACVDENPELLALSDHWAARALAGIKDPATYYNSEMGLSPEALGKNALFHTASGIQVVAALVALAHGVSGSHAELVRAFLDETTAPTRHLDTTMGRGGVLLGSLLLLEAQSEERLEQHARAAAYDLWRELEAVPSIAESTLPLNLGIAHGWAGLLYVLLRWYRTTTDRIPGTFRSRLLELADCAQETGRGLRWPWENLGDRMSCGTMPGWCNGSAGFVFLWTLAAEVFEESTWTGIAERAAWDAWQRSKAPGSLCCGSVGVAYALLNLARHTGDAVWIDRALRIANRAVAASGVPGESRDSLYKGDLGLTLLICELKHPEEARLPFFEDEGWSGGL